MENSNLDYNNFTNQYERILDQLEYLELSGGGKKKVDSDSESDGNVEEISTNSIQVGCVNITQSRDGLKFDAKICKTPKIRVNLKEDEVPLSAIVKILIQYVNKRLRMSNVVSVEMVKGKKRIQYDGDKLGDKVKISTMDDFDEVNIKMN
jgi:hypothetical protein